MACGRRVVVLAALLFAMHEVPIASADWIETERVSLDRPVPVPRTFISVGIDEGKMAISMMELFGQMPVCSLKVLRRSGGRYVEEQLVPSPAVIPGASISIDDAVMIVGSPGDADRGESAGAAYVFRFDGTSWSLEQKLLAADDVKEDGIRLTFENTMQIEGRDQPALVAESLIIVYP